MTATPPRRACLSDVATAVLAQLRNAIASGSLRAPVDRSALVGFGVRHQLDALEAALGGHTSAACLAVLDVAMAEREGRRPSPELVWTGPEAQGATARDTAVVLRELFESARESVLLAGFKFHEALDVLAPLFRVMRDGGVSASFIVHIPQVETTAAIEGHLDREMRKVLSEGWPFGDPKPRFYYDTRALVPGPPHSSMHAKCIVVDGKKAFVTSANFTSRAMDRNIEVGVLLDDPSFAGFLAAQWVGLIDAGIVQEYKAGV